MATLFIFTYIVNKKLIFGFSEQKPNACAFYQIWVEKRSYKPYPGLKESTDITYFIKNSPVVFDILKSEETNINFYILVEDLYCY